MRGQLRISSQRSPYLRAGLGWPSREPVLTNIVALTGEQLLELVRDPVLTVTVEDEDGQFVPFPVLDGRMTASHAQMMIDAIAADLPAAFDIATASEPVFEPRADLLAEKLAAAGFESLEQLLEEHRAIGGRVDLIGDQLKAAGVESVPALVTARDELADLSRGQAQQITDQGDKLTRLHADLKASEAEVEKLKSAAASTAAKPKTTAKAKSAEA